MMSTTSSHFGASLRRTELPVVCLTVTALVYCALHRHEQVRRQPYKGFIDQAKPIRKNTGIDFGQPAAPMVSKLLHSSLTVARIPETGPSFVGCLMSPLCEDSLWNPRESRETPHSGLMRQPTKEGPVSGILATVKLECKSFESIGAAGCLK